MTEQLDVWAGVPEVAALTAASRKVADRLGELTTQPARPLLSAADLSEHLADGGDVPADLGAQLYAAAHADEQTGLEREALLTARTRLAERLRATRVTHADVALRCLHVALVEQVIPAVRALAPTLRRVTDADDAVAAGLGDQWREMTALDGRHRAIRAEQHRITTEVLSDGHRAAQLIDRAGRFANVVDFAPWADRIANGPDDTTAPDMVSGGAVSVVRNRTGAPPSYGADGIAYTRWLARPDVQAWVPTVAELTDAADRIDDAVRDADQARTTARTGGPDKPFAGRGSPVAAFR